MEHVTTYSNRSLACRLLVAAPALIMAGCGTSAEARRYDALQAEVRRAGAVPTASDDEPFRGAARLDRATLVQAVLERNPTVAAARQGWQAALARYPQATALDDPMLSGEVAPLSVVRDDTAVGYSVQISQRFPFPGKLGLEGAVALAEAEAARDDFESTRLHLALMASSLFDDYFVVERSLEINAEHQQLLRELKESAEAQYEVGRASQQDALQAEVEVAHLTHDAIVLRTEREIVIAQLNGLLHRRPDLPIPPPPTELPAPVVPGQDELPELIEEALRTRPDLRGWRARIAGGESAVKLAERQYYPDLEVMASYNSMWAMPEHQWMVGVGVNIPLQRGRRRAAVDEAEAEAARAKHELARAADEARVEIVRAFRRAQESHHLVALHVDRLVPAARDQVAAARVGFVSGRNNFLAVVEAEKNLRTVELRLQMVRADLHRRMAELSRARGRVPGLTPGGEG